jgi:class 3 adenylate cyclase
MLNTASPQTLTFLFTDIEGSTPLWDTQREAMREATVQHNAILRRAIATHGGVSCGGRRFLRCFPGRRRRDACRYRMKNTSKRYSPKIQEPRFDWCLIIRPNIHAVGGGAVDCGRSAARTKRYGAGCVGQ